MFCLPHPTTHPTVVFVRRASISFFQPPWHQGQKSVKVNTGRIMFTWAGFRSASRDTPSKKRKNFYPWTNVRVGTSRHVCREAKNFNVQVNPVDILSLRTNTIILCFASIRWLVPVDLYTSLPTPASTPPFLHKQMLWCCCKKALYKSSDHLRQSNLATLAPKGFDPGSSAKCQTPSRKACPRL